jgi:hypothetical protein
VTISILPDDVLIEVFDFYVDQPGSLRHAREDAWHTLIHVSQRWRRIVFASPRRLNLQLLCTNKRSVREMLDIWPELPIVVFARARGGNSKAQWIEMTNAIAALEQHDRVCSINIQDIHSPLLKILAAIRTSFPALTDLSLWSKDQRAPVLPDSFLGSSAPRLRKISLEGTPFPGLGKLLLSTSDLVILLLFRIPHSGYISPESMVASLSALTRLEAFCLEFRSPRSRADRERRRPPPLRCVVLPALTRLQFKGDCEYLEDIVSKIDAPLLRRIYIRFFNQLVFDTPQLRYFISRAENFKSLHHAEAPFHDDHVGITLLPNAMHNHDGVRLHLQILCKPSDWQLASLAQVCDSALPPSSTLERLSINGYRRHWEDVEVTQWLELLHPFTSVKDLVLPMKSFQLVASALEMPAEGSVTGVLPALQSLFLQGPKPSEPELEAIVKFITPRKLSGCHVTVYHVDHLGRARSLNDAIESLLARGSRRRQRELEGAIEDEGKFKDMWRARALVLEALLRDKGHEVPRMSGA